MDKVVVIKRIPGILEPGDVLISAYPGADFLLEETSESRYGKSERFVNLDYATVSENIPEYFEFLIEEVYEKEPINVIFRVNRTDKEIYDRYQFFAEQLNNSMPGSEQDVVYTNLIWFIDWLVGTKNIIR